MKIQDDREWSIYTLSDPRTNEVRYVGFSVNPAQRLAAHMSRARHKGTHKQHWIAELIAQDMRPILGIVETAAGDWAAAERKWIAYFRSMGCKLVNLTDGGDGNLNYIPSDETRQKMSAAHKGKTHSPEAKAKVSASKKGKRFSAEHVAKLAIVRKGWDTSKAVAAAKEKVTGSKQSAEHVAKRIPNALSDDIVREIRALEGTMSQADIARKYGVRANVIHYIHRRKSYAYVQD